MGCISQKQPTLKQESKNTYIQPIPIDSYIVMKNIQLEGAPQNESLLQVHIKNQSSFQMKIIKNKALTIYDKEKEYKLISQTDDQQLKHDFIQFQIKDMDQKIVGEVSLNLFQAAVGPQKNNFKIIWKNKNINPGRISFEIDFQQKINLMFNIKNVEYNFGTTLPQYHYFQYSYKIQNQKIEIASENSDRISMQNLINKQNKQIDQIIETFEENFNADEIQEYINIKQIPITKLFIANMGEKRHFCVSQSLSSPQHSYSRKVSRDNINRILKEVIINLSPVNNQNEEFIQNWGDVQTLNRLNVDIISSDINETYLHFYIWGILPSQEGCKELFSECNISLNKLLLNQGKMVKIEGLIYQEIQTKIEQSMWLKGKFLGKVTLEYDLYIQAYLKQMIMGIRTEQGIFRLNPLIQDHKNKSQVTMASQNIKELMNCQQKLNILFFQQEESKKDEIFKQKLEIMEILEQLKKGLQTKTTQKIGGFYYSDEQSLQSAQQFFIQLIYDLSKFIYIEIGQLQDMLYECIEQALLRIEFSLQNMGFFGNKNGKQEKKNKIMISLQFHKLLISLLQITLKMLNQKGLSDVKQRFRIQILAILYFRIPALRTQLLKVIGKKNNQEVIEWKSVEYGLYDDENFSFGPNQQIQLYLDWNQNFYNFISQEPDYKEQNDALDKILQKQEWQEKLSKRKRKFFCFLQQLIEFINNVTQSADYIIPWHDIPGYKILLRILLQEIKIKMITNFPEYMINTVQSFLKDKKLLNIFIFLIFRKVNIYEMRSLMSCLNLTQRFFQVLVENKQLVQGNFDIEFFCEALKYIFMSDYAEAIAQTLFMLYVYYQLFKPEMIKKIVSELLLGNLFFKFFMHWSMKVRYFFYFLLWYRIHHQHKHQIQRIKSFYHMKKNCQAEIIYINKSEISIVNFKFQYTLLFLLIFQDKFIFNRLQRIQNILKIVQIEYFQIQDLVQQQRDTYYQKMKQKLIKKKYEKRVQKSELNGILYQAIQQERIKIKNNNLLINLKKIEDTTVKKPRRYLSKRYSLLTNQAINLPLPGEHVCSENEDGDFKKDENVKSTKKLALEEELFDIYTVNKSLNINSIEQQYIKYFPSAYQQYEDISFGYLQWFMIQNQQVNQTQQDQIRHSLVKQFAVPQLSFNSSIDKNENSYNVAYNLQ